MKYVQPDFYSFSEDSIELSKYVAKKYKDEQNLKVLDLCCGSGVVGIEFALEQKNVDKIVFIEEQEEFLSIIGTNANRFIPDIKINILINSFLKLNFPDEFDVILANPPYYLDGTGRQSSNEKRSDCHFISYEEYKAMFPIAKNCLKPGGEFYFLGVKDQAINKQYLAEGIIKIEKELSKSTIFKLIHSPS